MRRALLFLLPLLFTVGCRPGGKVIPDQGRQALILGSCSREDLGTEPYSEWFGKQYDGYQPDGDILRHLRSIDLTGYRFRIFFGSWCGDSKREVPRFIRLLDSLEIPEENRELIGVGNGDTLYKRSPSGEEKGLDIYRVPSFLVLKNGAEVNRITEFPVSSLERDLLSILRGDAYSPNYRTHRIITQWFSEGLLTDTNVSERGLANQIRSQVMNRGELGSCGRVLLGRGDAAAALMIFRMNRYLFPDDPGCYSDLAEGLLATGDRDGALGMIEKALEFKPERAERDRFMKLKDRITE